MKIPHEDTVFNQVTFQDPTRSRLARLGAGMSLGESVMVSPSFLIR